MPKKSSAEKVAFMGIMLATALLLAWLEGLIPPVAGMPAGVKLGLSNIVTMYCLLFAGLPQALLLAALKSGFVLLTRGATAGILSLAGGAMSVAAMALLKRAGRSPSYAALSVTGALTHNLAQLAAVSFLLRSAAFVYYLPVLVVSGVVMGLVTGTVLRAVMPAVQRAAEISFNHKIIK